MVLSSQDLKIDSTLDTLTKSVLNIQDDSLKTEMETELLIFQLKRDKIKALTAVAKCQQFLANMEILIAENELNMELHRFNTKSKLSTNSKTPSKNTNHTNRTSNKENKILKTIAKPKSTPKRTQKKQVKMAETRNINVPKANESFDSTNSLFEELRVNKPIKMEVDTQSSVSEKTVLLWLEK